MWPVAAAFWAAGQSSQSGLLLLWIACVCGCEAAADADDAASRRATPGYGWLGHMRIGASRALAGAARRADCAPERSSLRVPSAVRPRYRASSSGLCHVPTRLRVMGCHAALSCLPSGDDTG